MSNYSLLQFAIELSLKKYDNNKPESRLMFLYSCGVSYSDLYTFNVNNPFDFLLCRSSPDCRDISSTAIPNYTVNV